MKFLASLAIMLIACSTTVSTKSDPQPNFAAQAVLLAEPDAKCIDAYMGVGPDLTYGATCKLPNKQVVYVSLDVKNGVVPRSLNGTTTPQPQPQPQSPPPTHATGSGSGQ